MKKVLFGVLVTILSFNAFAADTTCVHYTTRDEVKAELVEFQKVYPHKWMNADLDYPQSVSPLPVSTKTRMEVKYELAEFQKVYPHKWMNADLEYPQSVMPLPVSTKTRAEVKAELNEFRKHNDIFGVDGYVDRKSVV